MGPLIKLAPSLGIGAKELGRAMLKAGLDSNLVNNGETLENRDLRRLVNP